MKLIIGKDKKDDIGEKRALEVRSPNGKSQMQETRQDMNKAMIDAQKKEDRGEPQQMTRKRNKLKH